MNKESQNKRITYFMHVPWDWAKQRPHFLAEYLSKDFEIFVVYKQNYLNIKRSGQENKIRIYPLYLLPFNTRYRILQVLNRLIIRIFYKALFLSSDIIWITSPDLYDLLPKKINSQLIYDCMDDMLSSPPIKKSKKISSFFRKSEMKLINDCDYLFCSSDYLKKVLLNRYKIDKEIIVINNGHSFENNNSTSKESIIKYNTQKINLIYIGTISSWMDWNLILASLRNRDDIIYHFVGPIEVQGPQHNDILFYGPQDHSLIPSIMNEADILIMPFVISDLILSVNPVKLYEYIYSKKPAISIRYPETERFSDYVYLYSNFSEYCRIISMLKGNNFQPKASDEKSKKFCNSNSWEERYKAVLKVINKQD